MDLMTEINSIIGEKHRCEGRVGLKMDKFESKIYTACLKFVYENKQWDHRDDVICDKNAEIERLREKIAQLKKKKSWFGWFKK